MSVRSFLVLGAGALGTAVAEALLKHPSCRESSCSVTISMRQGTLESFRAQEGNSTLSARFQEITELEQLGLNLIAADLVELSREELVILVKDFSCVIHAGGMTLPPCTQLKVTKAVLAAGVKEYVPWQWGVDYDVIGADGAFGLFNEAYEVRDLLRSQARTDWWIVSCGVFMSFVFEEFWGVIMRDEQSRITGVRALGGWDHMITATHVPDISKANANLALVDTDLRNRPVHISGTSVSYSDFADAVEKLAGRPIERALWTSEYLREQCKKDPEDKLAKYRLVFSEDKGLSWPQSGTYRWEEMEWDFENYMKHDIRSVSK